jgi:CBS domain-containing protein
VLVSDVMTQASITDSPSDTLRSAAERMWRQQTGSLLVMEYDRLVGVITERDVLKAAAQGRDIDKTAVGDLMTRNLITVHSTESVRDAARLMARHWIRHLPVVDDDKVLGVISQRDIVGIFAALSREEGAAEIEADKLVRARRLTRIEQGDLD